MRKHGPCPCFLTSGTDPAVAAYALRETCPLTPLPLAHRGSLVRRPSAASLTSQEATVAPGIGR